MMPVVTRGCHERVSDAEQAGRGGRRADAPDMTTGMSDFMMRSGRNWPRPEIPMPDLAVP